MSEHKHAHREDCKSGCHQHHGGEHHENVRVSVERHEGAFIGTLIKDCTSDYSTTKESLLCRIKTLRDWIKDNNGFIGHIKGFVKDSNSICTFSTVGGEITVRESSNTDDNKIVQINLVCIVFNIDKERLEERLISLNL